MLASLAFVPLEHINRAFDQMTEYLSTDNTYKPLLQWFQEQFLGLFSDHFLREFFSKEFI
jgi:hypothetical protein